MKAVRPKIPPLRLDPDAYDELRQQVIRRDNWRCQACGSMTNLEVHHQEFRSHSGDDAETNLITLCSTCHGQTHRINLKNGFCHRQDDAADYL
ncbi:MAG TPA: HNH endonuclease [Candidatus Sulfotelmatobacter sp.]|nr:HNH endonuclease [Candidatus Sulfotelmatobacter sp.]